MSKKTTDLHPHVELFRTTFPHGYRGYIFDVGYYAAFIYEGVGWKSDYTEPALEIMRQSWYWAWVERKMQFALHAMYSMSRTHSPKGAKAQIIHLRQHFCKRQIAMSYEHLKAMMEGQDSRLCDHLPKAKKATAELA